MSLAAVLADVWLRLEDAADGARSRWHLPTLATVADGRPQARVVVLQHVDRQRRTLAWHCDGRSPKAAQVAADPHVALLFYDAPARLQVRVQGVATLHAEDAIADAGWAATRLDSRRCYLAPHPPGTPADGPAGNLPADLDGNPDERRSEAGRANFAVARCRIERLDWLLLNARGHRRAEFVWRGGDASPVACWTMP